MAEWPVQIVCQSFLFVMSTDTHMFKVGMSLQGPCRLKLSTLWRWKQGAQTITARGFRVRGMVGNGGGTIAHYRGLSWMGPMFRLRIV